MKIPLLAMYSRPLYEAIEAYAADRDDRRKYDAIIEAATDTANSWLKRQAGGDTGTQDQESNGVFGAGT